ncbi:MAG: hypothetical protein WKF37_12420 [Bryobacteraceae bacterium]
MTDAMHDSARITRSFLAGTNEWQTVGTVPADNILLRQRGGVALQFRNEMDQTISLKTAMATNSVALRIRSGEIVFNENVLAQAPLQVSATSTGNTPLRSDIALTPGQTRAVVVTVGGINIGAVIPNFGDVQPRAVAPGSFVSIYGTGLATSTETAPELPIPSHSLTRRFWSTISRLASSAPAARRLTQSCPTARPVR